MTFNLETLFTDGENFEKDKNWRIFEKKALFKPYFELTLNLLTI